MTRTNANLTGHTSRRPSLLMNLISTMLASMFLGVSGGNVELARMAAFEIISDYRARNNADLIAVAQIVAFGLATLGSLSLSLSDDISIPMALRLRGNANACNRSAEQNRRALRQKPTDDRSPEAPPEIWPEYDTAPAEPEPLPTPKDAEPLPAEDGARLNDPDQIAAETPSPDAPTTTDHDNAETREQEMWAIALIKEASEITASLPSLPLAERDAAAKHAALLGSVAHDLLYGGGPPPFEQHPGSAQPPRQPSPPSGNADTRNPMSFNPGAALLQVSSR